MKKPTLKCMFQFMFLVSLCLPVGSSLAQERVIVSTDIGGTDPDDFQSMIHYLMYADTFQTEGLISSPYGGGRKEDILKIIDLYEKDLSKLKKHSKGFPSPAYLRSLTKQGAIEMAPSKGWSASSEGSEWIIERAKIKSEKPLWVLIWGGLEDVAQALHDAPEIATAIRVYWIGGPNKKWSVNAYNYIVNHFPDLFFIEANSTYRGFFLDEDPQSDISVNNFYNSHIKGRGAMGRDFVNYYEGEIKMGDTPSVLYVMHGEPEDPAGDSWGGSFVPLKQSAKRQFRSLTGIADTVPVFSVMEWILDGPDAGIKPGAPALQISIAEQQFDGTYLGNGKYQLRFVPKTVGNWEYELISEIEEFNGLKGEFVSVDPWPGNPEPDNIKDLSSWWSDDPAPDTFEKGHQGAKTVYQWREEFMSDWADRWEWLAED